MHINFSSFVMCVLYLLYGDKRGVSIDGKRKDTLPALHHPLQLFILAL